MEKKEALSMRTPDKLGYTYKFVIPVSLATKFNIDMLEWKRSDGSQT